MKKCQRMVSLGPGIRGLKPCGDIATKTEYKANHEEDVCDRHWSGTPPHVAKILDFEKFIMGIESIKDDHDRHMLLACCESIRMTLSNKNKKE